MHCHVPVFLPEAGLAATTQDFLEEILALHRQQPISDHLEVETYTWSVLPGGAPVDDDALAAGLAAELAWVHDELVGLGLTPLPSRTPQP